MCYSEESWSEEGGRETHFAAKPAGRCRSCERGINNNAINSGFGETTFNNNVHAACVVVVDATLPNMLFRPRYIKPVVYPFSMPSG